MPRGKAKEPGFKALTLPQSPGQMGPEMRDTDDTRGALAHVPRNPIYHVQDFGAPQIGPADWRMTTSPASATFTAGKPTLREQEKETKEYVSQIPGSLQATP
jgi:hypothetical protein